MSKMKRWFKLFGALSLIIGAFLLFSSQTGLTGAVIGTEKAGSIGSILGLVLIIGGVFGVMVRGLEKDYYTRRVNELTEYRGTNEWIAQWEYEGIQDELRRRNINTRETEIHEGGISGPISRHFNLYGKGLKKHVFITPNPNDERLYWIFKQNRPKKFKNEKQRNDEYTKIFKKISEITPKENLLKKSSYDEKERFK